MDQSSAREPNPYVLEEQIKQLTKVVNDGFDRLEKRLDDILKEQKKQVEDHEQRIRALEEFRWKWVGIIAFGSFLIALLAQVAL